MARSRYRGTLVDYLVAAIEPALIMVMVGSLMFFLLDTWYEGAALDRLRWILFWFVFGIVLIARVSMQIGSELAKAYGMALGGAVALVGTVLAGFQPFLLIVMGIVWWATHKLTYDCTLLDEDQDTGVGLLQQSGLDAAAMAEAGLDHIDDGPASRGIGDPDAMESSLMPDRPWWKFWEADPEGASRPHAPGVWLIYFTVASLPMFGLGQWLVPAVQEDRRAWLFLYFLAYMASGMGAAALDELPEPAALPPQAEAPDAGGDDRDLAVDRRHHDHRPDAGGGRPARADLRHAGRTQPGRRRRATSARRITPCSRTAACRARVPAARARPRRNPAGNRKNRARPRARGRPTIPTPRSRSTARGNPAAPSGQGRSKSGAAKGKPASSKNGQQGKSGARQDQSGEQGKAKGQDQEQGKSEDGRSDQASDEKGDAEKG